MLNKNIVLIGMPGCGKTSIGKIVSEKLFLPFYDVDEYLEAKEGKPIKDIFLKGEAYFRELESSSIKEIVNNCPSVISTGGGAVKVPRNMEILQKNSIIIFINRPLENIIKDIDTSTRPLLLEGQSKLYKLFEERYPLYMQFNDLEVLNDTTIEEAADSIIKLL
ncbi:shikimate kinase [Clostridium swellfunianum]|uniref:shikimate kinase n=1 Tax=Clostridium swellfunianum TaxID=1367462 RepID=UPI002030082C|nr:shikimate kinase [Clostridium swellfunianum]MCM0650676.1 shikimate kinase [Clostridium swellfunianum]